MAIEAHPIPSISLEAQHLVKRYGGVVALADGTLAVRSGEVVALLGANGSGKSTLSKIITGVVSPNAGTLLIDGAPAHFSNPQAARHLGIAPVFQELSLIPDLTVAENIWLTHEPLSGAGTLRRGEMQRRTRALIDLFAGTVRPVLEPDSRIADLTPDERQIVEILKALSQQPRLLILDEATASLDSAQVARLFTLVGDLKARGMAIVFVSHRMEEIFRVADRATVLRNGCTVGERTISATNERDLVQLMIEQAERAEHSELPPPPADAPVRLAVRDLRSDVLAGVSFELRDGELLGLGGLQGQGQANLLMAIFGATRSTGTLLVNGRPRRYHHPSDAMRDGVALVPGDRGSEGLLLIRSILENQMLASWNRYSLPIRQQRALQDGMRMADDLRLVRASLHAPVSSLSGGNAQKVVIAKWLLRAPKLLLLNDPTKGIDVGAKQEFYQLLRALRAAGTAILFYSSDDDELLGLCDRVLVLHDGRIRAELTGSALTREKLVATSMGAT
jgi:ribose transport system ATP-binding protein